MSQPVNLRYRRQRFLTEVIAYAVWLYFSFPQPANDRKDARGNGIDEAVRRLTEKFRRDFLTNIRCRVPQRDAKWEMEIVFSIAGRNWLWRAASMRTALFSMFSFKALAAEKPPAASGQAPPKDRQAALRVTIADKLSWHDNRGEFPSIAPGLEVVGAAMAA